MTRDLFDVKPAGHEEWSGPRSRRGDARVMSQVQFAPTETVGTRERILDGAALLFSEHGYAYGSIRNIAAAVGIQGASFYYHFASKEEMTEVLLREAAQTAMAVIADVDVDGLADRPYALLEAAIEAHFTAYRDPKRRLMALTRIYWHLPGDLFEVGRAELRTYLEKWAQIIRRLGVSGDRPHEPEILAFILFGAANSLMDWDQRPGFAVDTPQARSLLTQMLFHGIRAAGSPSRPMP